MPREDYEKFLEVASDYLPPHIFLQNLDSEKEYLTGFAKLRNTNTTFIETTVKEFNINHGVYIDIFPLDGYPSSKVKIHSLEFFKKLYNFRISSELYSVEKRSFVKRCLSVLIKLIYPNTKKVAFKKDNLFKKYNYYDCDYIVNHNGAWGHKEIVKRKVFDNGCVKKFENLDIVVPSDYDSYLKSLYGDYMTPPPKEKQISHHDTVVIDLDKTFREYNKQG